jgi:hypothetical protein
MEQFDVNTFNVSAFDAILARGLSYGLGETNGQMCIEAAICSVLGLPHGDDPGCVASVVRSFKISLNDSSWSSEKARAKGLRDLGLAQLGSKGVVDDVEFATRIAEKTIRVLVPMLLREVAGKDSKCMAAADRCEKEGSEDAARDAARGAASDAARYAASDAARYAARAARDAARYAASAARAASDAARAASDAARDAASDKYLLLMAGMGLEVLRELNSPGIALLGVPA